MIQNGVRGVLVGDPDDVDPDTYGIDWEDIDHPRFRNHHNTHNPEAPVENNNPFVVNHPSHLSRVDVFDPRCPFNPGQITLLNSQLELLPHYRLSDMHSRRLTWIDGLAFATLIMATI